MSKRVARLYTQFQPENYGLHLSIHPDGMVFNGTVVIKGKKVGRPSQRLTFHQKGLKITNATITKHDKKGDQALEVERINNQDSLDEVRLHTAGMVYPGEYTVVMDFEGEITRPMNGIYPCDFKLGGKEKKLIATQFESHHAREAFPCIDEPQAKATFDLALVTPKVGTVLSNTPVTKQEKLGDRLVTTFETTPRMSTYLLAFVYGELGYKEAKTKDGVVVRTYATPDKVELTDHGLDVAVRALEFFSDYFGIPYPLPKLDMVALPDFASGAMENWGLVTYRETAMLADPKSSSIESRQMVALVIAHELSHQWFGNLVTMQWWDDLWLNESFANLMEYVAVDALQPEWHIWEQFVAHETTSAKRRDSLADVQPIRCEVRHPDEISSLFDPAIVYAKGGSVLHMLMRYIGEDAFKAGLKTYFEKHAYGNTRADDLWAALGAASHHDINGFMSGWLTRPGYPLVEVDWQPGGDKLNLSQRRFLSDPSATSDDKPWEVPLAATHQLAKPVLSHQNASLSVKIQGEKPLLFNHDGHSYFLPRYSDQAHLQQIVNGLKRREIDVIDRYLLLDNYIMLQRGGVSATTELLDLLQAYEDEASETVWGALAMSIGEVRKLVETDEASEQQLDALVQQLVLPVAESLGWDDKPGDSAQTLRLRGLTNSVAAGAKTKSIIDEGLRRFKDFQQPSDLSASTRAIVYFCAARYGTDADFKKLLRLYQTVKNADEKDEVASGLTSVKKPQQYKNLLELLTGDDIRRQDALHWFAWLLRNRYSRATTWQWLKTHWDWIEQEFASDKSYGYFARLPGGVFSLESELKEFKQFFGSKKSVVALAREIMLAEQEIASRIAWRGRNEADVRAWLKQQ